MPSHRGRKPGPACLGARRQNSTWIQDNILCVFLMAWEDESAREGNASPLRKSGESSYVFQKVPVYSKNKRILSAISHFSSLMEEEWKLFDTDIPSHLKSLGNSEKKEPMDRISYSYLRGVWRLITQAKAIEDWVESQLGIGKGNSQKRVWVVRGNTSLFNFLIIYRKTMR